MFVDPRHCHGKFSGIQWITPQGRPCSPLVPDADQILCVQPLEGPFFQSEVEGIWIVPRHPAEEWVSICAVVKNNDGKLVHSSPIFIKDSEDNIRKEFGTNVSNIWYRYSKEDWTDEFSFEGELVQAVVL